MSSVVFSTAAQEDDGAGLLAQDVKIITQTDLFGQDVQLIEGSLVNQDEVAYANIVLFAEVTDAEGNIIGEGFGFPVNACGGGLIDFVLQPGQSQPFSMNIELFEEGEVDRASVLPEGEAVEPTAEEPVDLERVRQITTDEVVNVEWVDAESLLYAVGCDTDVFTNQQWYTYNLTADISSVTTHPRTTAITTAMLQQVGLTEPNYFNHSMMTFAPGGRRMVYQTEINTMITAEPDGSFKRLIYENLSRHSLHGFIWLPQGRFLAYYYGAYGEEVRYFTASVEGQLISADLYNTTPSVTVPGPSLDGSQVVIGTTIDEVTGYYLKSTIYPTVEMLFETEELPGNNYPAPIFASYEGAGIVVFIVRPVDDTPMLQCINLQTRQLRDITALPLEIGTDDRAWTFISPDATNIALAANGVNGGLWMIDLPPQGGCGSAG